MLLFTKNSHFSGLRLSDLDFRLDFRLFEIFGIDSRLDFRLKKFFELDCGLRL